MSLNYFQQSWDALARTDAMWAVLTCNGKEGGQWGAEEFFETGRTDIRNILERLNHWKVPVTHGRALDFGCGLGRLTSALADHFEQVDGVDISGEMVERASRLHQHRTHLRFLHNPHPDLSRLEDASYDFLLSLISLQHMPERAALRYLQDFPRILKPGGIGYFQLGTFLDASDPVARAKLKRDRSPSTRVYRSLRRIFGSSPLRMNTYYCRLSRVCDVLEKAQVRVISVFPDESLPPPFIAHTVVFQTLRLE